MYKIVDLQKYVAEKILAKKVITAVKVGKVLAEYGQTGQRVISWTVDSNGKALKEREGILKDNDVILTKLNKENIPVLDVHGHKNQWIVSRNYLKERYQLLADDIYVPIPKEQYFIQVTENIVFHKDNEKMYLSKGGYVNVDTLTAISIRDFTDTYLIKEEI